MSDVDDIYRREPMEPPPPMPRTPLDESVTPEQREARKRSAKHYLAIAREILAGKKEAS